MRRSRVLGPLTPATGTLFGEIEMQHDWNDWNGWQKELEALEVDPDIDRVIRIAFVVSLVIACSFVPIGAVLIVRGLM
jgi:hypothetical protein